MKPASVTPTPASHGHTDYCTTPAMRLSVFAVRYSGQFNSKTSARGLALTAEQGRESHARVPGKQLMRQNPMSDNKAAQATSCWPWSHKWSKWRQCQADFIITPGLFSKDHTPVEVTRRWQERICTVCEKLQREDIKL